MYSFLEKINEVILQNAPKIKNIGLLNGKMGICIYFFHFGRQANNQMCTELAESLVDDVYQHIGNSAKSIGFENGLAGIAWGLEYLVQNSFLDADTDEILSDLDDRIFQYLVEHRKLPIDLQNGLLGYGFYLLFRLKNKVSEDAKGHNFLLNRLMIELINRLYEIIEEEEMLKEPMRFEIIWPLPLTLILLMEVKKLNIYNSKVDIVINRLAPIALSTVPVNNSNRLFFFIGMKAVLQQVRLDGWDEHVALIKQSIRMNIVSEEFSDKNITAAKGLSGIGLILMFSNISEDDQYINLLSEIAEKIERSTLWEDIKGKKSFQSKDLGLLEGLTGVTLLSLHLLKFQKK